MIRAQCRTGIVRLIKARPKSQQFALSNHAKEFGMLFRNREPATTATTPRQFALNDPLGVSTRIYTRCQKCDQSQNLLKFKLIEIRILAHRPNPFTLRTV